MSHIAVITTGLTGILNASFEVVSKLQSEGHKVTYLCPQDVREKVELQGFTYVQLPKINFTFWEMDKSGNILESWRQRFRYHLRNVSKNYNPGKERLKLESLQKTLHDIRPDTLLIDIELHELIFSAVELGLPFTLLSQWFPNIRDVNVPPITKDIVPGNGFHGSKLGIALVWLKLRIKVSLIVFLSSLRLKNYRRLVLNRYAKELNVLGNSLKASTFPPLYTYTKWPMVCMVMQELEFPSLPLENIRYAGAMVFDRRVDDKNGNRDLDEIEKIFFLKEKEHKKLVYCSVSTLDSGDVRFIKKVIVAVGKVPDWVLVLSLGGKLKVEDFQPIPDNVFLFNWVPQLRILEKADCSINHAGIHTINECIHFAVPMLVYSGKRYDQNGCAARIAYHGLGITGDKDGDTIEIIKEKIHRILNEDSYRKRIDEMNLAYRLTKKRSFSPFLGITS